MKTSLLPSTTALFGVLVLSSVFNPAAGIAADANLKKIFAVQPGGQLVVDVDLGSIDITTGDGTRIEVQVLRKITRGSDAKADELLAAQEVTFAQNGNTVEVHAKRKKDFSTWLSLGGPNLQVEYKITMPKKFNLDLKTAGGSISCGDLEGELKAKTAGGNLKFAAVSGPVNAHTSGGSITLGNAAAAVMAKTAGGNIHLGEMFADTTAETSGGSIEVKLSKAPLTAKTAGGNILIGDARATVEARTSGGSITATFSAQPKEDCHLSTAGGSIHVKVASNLAFDIDARTSAGGVSTGLPVVVQGEVKRSQLQGKLNGGGKVLVMKSSAGSISLEKL
jgi:hypothetical protein